MAATRRALVNCQIDLVAAIAPLYRSITENSPQGALKQSNDPAKPGIIAYLPLDKLFEGLLSRHA